MFQKLLIRGMTLDEAMDVLGVKKTRGTKTQAIFNNAKTRRGEKISAQRALMKGKRTGILKKL